MLAGVIAALGLAPATVAAPPPVEQVGQWELDPDGPGKCVVKRNYAGGTRVEFIGEPGGIRVLDVRNAGWPEPSGGPYKLVSLRGRERLELDRNNSAPNGLRLMIGPDPGDQVAASDAIEVVRPDGSVLERVDLSGIATAEARLPGCMARAAKHPWIIVPAPMAPVPPMLLPPQVVLPPLERQGLGRPALAKVALHALFTEMDYPSAAVRASEQGTVRFRLLVGTDGRVTGCVITASSSSESLDSTTCRVLAARAVFEPARDREGRPATDSVNGRIVWSLEPVPPPPPPQ